MVKHFFGIKFGIAVAVIRNAIKGDSRETLLLTVTQQSSHNVGRRLLLHIVGLLSADLLTPNHAFSFPSCIKTLIFTLLFPLQCTKGRKTLDILAPALLMMFSGIFCLPIVSLLSENKILMFEVRQHFGGLTKNVCGEMRFPTN